MKKNLLFILTFFSFLAATAQERIITGKVTSIDNGEVLPGVNVVLKDTNIGTVTDLDGNYSIATSMEDGVLIFSFIGFQTIEERMNGRTTINAEMMNDVKQLSEVVVTAFGVEKDEKAVSYAIQSVQGDKLTEARESNLVNSLAGRIAGVQITNTSGAVGASSRIVLRGPSSITGSNQPLFVVDGLPIDNGNYGNATSSGGFDAPNGASDINPDDIATISVLKGPNAAALYGTRAANGVIVITTKSGKGRKGVGVSVNNSVTFENPLRLPKYQNSYGQGASPDYFEFVDGTHGIGDGVDESWGPALDKGYEFVQWNSNGQPAPWVSRPDNVKDFFETGVTVNTNISLTGGNESNSYRLSLTQMDQKGMVPNTDYKRFTMSVAASSNLTEKLSSNVRLNYIKSGSDNLPIQGYSSENPVQQMVWAGRNVDIPALKDWRNLPLADPSTAAAGTPINWNTAFQNNPYWVLDNNLNGLAKDRIYGNLEIKYSFTDWLSVKGKTGTDYWSSMTTEQKAMGTNEAKFGFYRETARVNYEINNELLLMFNKPISGDFNLSLNVGGNRMYNYYSRLTGSAPQLELPGIYNLSNVRSGVSAVLTNLHEEYAINSVFAFGQVSFRNFAFLDFSGRNDWSSVMPLDNNSFFYPSVTGSVVVTDLFENTSDILSYLKFRGGWSKVGSNGALGPYDLQQVFEFRNTPWNNILLPYNPETLNNPNLKPEVTTGVELGVDVRLFNGRLTLDATYYNQTNSDLLLPVEVSASSGYQYAWKNIGEMKNTGIELQLGIVPIETKDFRAAVNVNFAKNNNEVVSLGGLGALNLGGHWAVNLQAREGLPFGTLFGTAYLRDPQGNVIHENGLPVMDTESKVLGNIQPDWTGGVNLDLSYKGFSFNTLVDAKMGGELHSMSYTFGRTTGVLEETLLGREGGLVGVGVKNIGTAENPVYVTNDVVVDARTYNQKAHDSDMAESGILDASFVKLRQVQLGYKIPQRWLAKLPITDLNVSVVGRNLAILYSKTHHIDPETGFSSDDANQGLEFGQLPSARSIGFNINFKF